MNITNTLIKKMYYVPTYYYWLDRDNLYSNIKDELNINFMQSKDIFYRNIKLNNKFIEKTEEYNQYKSNLIRMILFDYVHNCPNNLGKELIIKIFNKWESKNIKSKDKELIYNRTFNKILKYEKIISNIEDIMMLINLKMLENYYE